MRKLGIRKIDILETLFLATVTFKKIEGNAINRIKVNQILIFKAETVFNLKTFEDTWSEPPQIKQF